MRPPTEIPRLRKLAYREPPDDEEEFEDDEEDEDDEGGYEEPPDEDARAPVSRARCSRASRSAPT